MSAPRLRALVLCAGHGTRLRPLTAFCPKPLLPVAGVPIVGRTLSILRQAGCEEAILNLHHLGDRIRGRLGDDWEGMPLVYSKEPEILGTLGALAPIRERLADCDGVLVINGDSLCRWPIRALVRRHLKKEAGATLLVHTSSPRPELGGGVAVDSAQRVVAIRDAAPIATVHRRHVFAGAQLLDPRLLERVPDPPEFGDLIAGLYLPLLDEGSRIEAVVTRRRWQDLGTPRRYLDACLDAVKRHRRLKPASSWIADGATLGEEVTVRSSSIEDGVRVGTGSRIESSVLLEGAEIPPSTVLERVVVGPQVRLPPNAELESMLVTTLPTGHSLGKGESQLGDLVYCRIGSSD